MRRLVVAVMAVSVLTVAACNHGAGKRADTAHPQPATTSGSPASAATRSRFTDGELRSALLAADDLPTGWSTEPHSDPTTDQSSSWGNCTALDNADDWKGTSTAAGDFLSPAGATITEQVDAATPAKLRDLFTLLTKVTGCGSFTVGTTTFTTNGLSFPKLGDQTFAMRLTWTASGNRMGADTIFVRRGNVLISIGNEPSYATGVYLPDTATTEDFARRALGKIDRVLAP